MRTIAVIPGTEKIDLADRPDQSITAPDEVKVRMLRVEICETARPVSRVRSGDYAVFTVRRGCGRCLLCAMNRSDRCRSGEYRERGIRGLDAYRAGYVVDKEPYVVRLPPELEGSGVLTETLSVLEKAIDEALRLQFARLPDAPATPDWLQGRRSLVSGLGPIDRVLEATGVAALEFNLLDALASNGVYVLTGIPGGNRPLEILGSELVCRWVPGNQFMLGSVNASRDHFQMAVDDLSLVRRRWGDRVDRLIAHRHPCAEFKAALDQHGSEEIKVVVEWAS